jgi:hypothetical protein
LKLITYCRILSGAITVDLRTEEVGNDLETAFSLERLHSQVLLVLNIHRLSRVFLRQDGKLRGLVLNVEIANLLELLTSLDRGEVIVEGVHARVFERLELNQIAVRLWRQLVEHTLLSLQNDVLSQILHKPRCLLLNLCLLPLRLLLI